MDSTYRTEAEARLSDTTGGAAYEAAAAATGVIYAAVALRQYSMLIPEKIWYIGVIMLGIGGGSHAAVGLVTLGALAGSRQWTAPCENGERLPWVTAFRALLMLSTVYCILAVDFTPFPIIHMKTTMYGQSLMDIGVGAFVFSHGVVQGHKVMTDPTQAAKKWAKTTLPLSMLGVVRIIVTKSLNYHEHLEEYGVHWNFFFTLAVLPVAFYVIKPIPLYISFPLLIFWQGFWATSLHGAEYITSPDRSNLISMNKEGIFSLPGYLALFISGCLSRSTTIFPLLCIVGYCVASIYHGPASRRLCNPTYILMVSAICSCTLSALSRLPAKVLTSPVLSKVSTHSLAVFLVANLMTGCVNLTIETLRTPWYYSYCILGVYMVGAVEVGTHVGLRI